jgi:hypothetical protein
MRVYTRVFSTVGGVTAAAERWSMDTDALFEVKDGEDETGDLGVMGVGIRGPQSWSSAITPCNMQNNYDHVPFARLSFPVPIDKGQDQCADGVEDRNGGYLAVGAEAGEDWPCKTGSFSR